MRRYLLAFAVIPLAAVSFRVLAQDRSAAVSSAEKAASSRSQQPSSLAGIQSDKAVEIVAGNLSPRALSFDSAANLFLTNAAAPNRVFALTNRSALAISESTPQGATLSLAAGIGVAGSLGDGGNALAAQFNVRTDSLFLRSGIAVAADGTMLIADTLNSTIRRVAGSDSPEPGVIRSIAGRWAASKSVQLVEPLGLALNDGGDLYVADHSAGAVDFLPGAVASLPGRQEIQLLAHVAGAASLALTRDGRKLFVASPETGAVVAIDTQTREIQSIAGFPVQSVTPEAASKPLCVAALPASEPAQPSSICPAGVAVDAAANLFVADSNSGRILRVDAQTSRLTTAASGLRSPGEMAFDNDGNLYVAEQGAGRIIKFVSMGANPANLTITPPATLSAPPAPRVCPQAAPFNFCDQPVGGSTPTQAFILTNNTSAAVSGLTISFTGSNTADFQDASSTCGASLAAGTSCTVNVDFAPTASGARSANLAAADSAGDSAIAALSGTGDDFQLTLDGQQEQAVIQGGTLTYKFNVVPDAVFGGTVAIACPADVPPLTTCTPSASTVSVTPGTPAPFSVTFQTTYNGVTGGFPGNGLLLPLRFPRGGPPTIPPIALGGSLAFLAAFALLIFFRTSDRAKPLVSSRFIPGKAVVILGFCLAISGVAFLAGCKHYSVPASLNTPPGSTTMTIHASAQNAGRGVTIILDVTGRG
ncbi:MAG: choice-of-anchor D domain-containing protein [Candidatus Acidiferrales bacterium]